MNSPWRALESLPGLNAVPAVWREKLGEQFDVFARSFFQPRPEPAQYVPCRKCGCSHEVGTLDDLGPEPSPHHPSSTIHHPLSPSQPRLVAICTCDPWNCNHLVLAPSDIEILELHWGKLARALCKAFALDFKAAEFGLHNTRQIGSWSTGNIPVILTIQHDKQAVRTVVAELANRLRQKFILLSPTSDHLDATCQEWLARDGAAHFAIDAHVILNPDGTLCPQIPPPELFGRFLRAATQPRRSSNHPSSTIRPPALPPSAAPCRHSLRKGRGFWRLTFEGEQAELKHEQGIFYVAWLLANPPDRPIHALDLAAKVPSIYRQHLGLAEIVDPASGKAACLTSQARLQERSLGLDDATGLRNLLAKQRELEAILDDDDASEPVKAEALRDLEAIAEFQRKHGRRTEDNAQKAVRAVRRAITRFHENLESARDANGQPHPVLVPFAAHLKQCLLLPTSRRLDHPGCFTYEPPPGVKWTL